MLASDPTRPPEIRPAVPPLRPLSPRERQLVEVFVMTGGSNAQLAVALGVGPGTIRGMFDRLQRCVIPGTLPARTRVMLWARGADAWVLYALRSSVPSTSPRPFAATRHPVSRSPVSALEHAG